MAKYFANCRGQVPIRQKGLKRNNENSTALFTTKLAKQLHANKQTNNDATIYSQTRTLYLSCN